MLTNDRWGVVAFTWPAISKKVLKRLLLTWVWNLLIWDCSQIPRGQWVKPNLKGCFSLITSEFWSWIIFFFLEKKGPNHGISAHTDKDASLSEEKKSYCGMWSWDCSLTSFKSIIAIFIGHQAATFWTKFCTCQDSRAVVSWAKFCSNHFVRIDLRAKSNFHQMWIVMVKTLVKWAPGSPGPGSNDDECDHTIQLYIASLIGRFTGPTWGLSGADICVGPMNFAIWDKMQCSSEIFEKWGQMTHHIGKYGDTTGSNFSGVSSIILLLLISNLWGTRVPVNKIIGDIPDFTVLNVPIFQPRHNTENGIPK